MSTGCAYFPGNKYWRNTYFRGALIFCYTGLTKNNPRISRRLSVLQNTSINSFIFLHDGRGQHCATSDLGVPFQKKLSRDWQGIKFQKIFWHLHTTWNFFDIFSETAIHFLFFAWRQRPTLCNIWSSYWVSKKIIQGLAGD